MKRSFLAAALLILLHSCKKEIDELPDATQTGAHTFGAKVDGKFWVPQKFGIVAGAPLLEARLTGTGSVVINARNFASAPTETEFELYIHQVTGTGVYPLDQSTGKYPGQGASYAYFIKRKLMPLNEWITSPSHKGSITITRFDTAARVISGTFEFTAGSMDATAAPLSVTEGRFDATLQ